MVNVEGSVFHHTFTNFLIELLKAIMLFEKVLWLDFIKSVQLSDTVS